MSCRQKFPMVRHKVGTLAGYLRKAGPERSIDMDEAGMRLALDIVALVGLLTTAGSSTYKFNHIGLCSICNTPLLISGSHCNLAPL